MLLTRIATIFVTFIVLILSGDVAKSARAEIEQPRPFFKRTDCGTICQRVRCAPAKKEECHPVKEVFVERDGDCYCCDTCAPRVQVSSLNKKCEANFCDSVKCHDVPANDCFNKGMAYMPKDGDCSCCDQCESL